MTLRPLPTIFLPGLLCDEGLWREVQHVGGHIADLTAHDSMETLARSVLEKAPPRFHLVALSMGGYVAFEMLRQAPARIESLLLFDTSARPDTPEQKERRRLLLAMSKKGQFKGVTPRLLPMLIHPDRLKDEELTNAIMTMAERVGRDAFQNQQTAIMNRVDSRPSLKDIRCRTLVVGGRQDVLTPPEILQEIVDGISGATLRIIDDCGHLPPLEKSGIVMEILKDWLAEG